MMRILSYDTDERTGPSESLECKKQANRAEVRDEML